MAKKNRKPPSRKQKIRSVENRQWNGRLLATVFFLICMGGFGLWWKHQVVFQDVQIQGARFANQDSLRQLADIDSSMLFFDAVPELIASRVSTHPWVQSARVKRLPRAEFLISVTERVPVLLLMDDEGKPDRFLDKDGFQMPFHSEALFDVPLLTGFSEIYHPSRPVENESIRHLLGVLGDLDADTDALLSSFTIEPNGELYLHTAPKPGRGSIFVRLGHGAYEQKLSKLYAFWHQAVLPKHEYNIKTIDLRFNSQIITEEVRLSQ